MKIPFSRIDTPPTETFRHCILFDVYDDDAVGSAVAP